MVKGNNKITVAHTHRIRVSNQVLCVAAFIRYPHSTLRHESICFFSNVSVVSGMPSGPQTHIKYADNFDDDGLDLAERLCCRI